MMNLEKQLIKDKNDTELCYRTHNTVLRLIVKDKDHFKQIIELFEDFYNKSKLGCD